jgi:hypothetical protein
VKEGISMDQPTQPTPRRRCVPPWYDDRVLLQYAFEVLESGDSQRPV